MEFKNIFNKSVVKPNFVMPNRFIMGSMHTGLEDLSDSFSKLANFYALRAAGGVGLIITGGFSPNFFGRLTLGSSQLSFKYQAKQHKTITNAVHQYDSKICMQILHAGRYSYHPFNFSASNIKAKINPFTPFKMSQFHIKKTIKDFVDCAHLACEAGYDGVEIMGSEGYLINQFLCTRTNNRKDDWGGSFQNRARLAVEIVRGIRQQLPDNFLIIFRLSMLDLVKQGSSFNEVVELAKLLAKSGVDLINTGIGWHEARIPTIATSVPRAAFTWITARIKQEVDVLTVASNRINTPEVAESILAQGHADFVSMARPFLADPDFVNKAKQGKSRLINTCIACNQSCLDNVFKRKRASCLVNPQACYEIELPLIKVSKPKKLAVLGAGPAGMAFAVYASQVGHKVTVYEKSSTIGGQFNYAAQIPGKEEFKETLRYFKEQFKELGVALHLNTELKEQDFISLKYDALVVATGVLPRALDIAGVDSEKVVSYQDFFALKQPDFNKVAILGAGGVGVDLAHYVALQDQSIAFDIDKWLLWWGIDKDYKNAGALTEPAAASGDKEIFLLQRKTSKIGKFLGKTTGWIHRANLIKHKVSQYTGVDYRKIDDSGLHIEVDGRLDVINADKVVICAGQISNKQNITWVDSVKQPVYLIGGAKKAADLDAATAIKDALMLAREI